jgi:hypothetical protein
MKQFLTPQHTISDTNETVTEIVLGYFILPSFPSALQLRMSFGLLNNLSPFFSIPRLSVF